MRDRIFRPKTDRIPVADLPTAEIQRQLREGIKCKESIRADVILRLEIELIARAHGWPTKRSA